MSEYDRKADETNLEWPYPVNYGRENEVEADILMLGGGVAGCHAAYHAAKRGAKVVIVYILNYIVAKKIMISISNTFRHKVNQAIILNGYILFSLH